MIIKINPANFVNLKSFVRRQPISDGENHFHHHSIESRLPLIFDQSSANREKNKIKNDTK
jgi:hypothetical protein